MTDYNWQLIYSSDRSNPLIIDIYLTKDGEKVYRPYKFSLGDKMSFAAFDCSSDRDQAYRIIGGKIEFRSPRSTDFPSPIIANDGRGQAGGIAFFLLEPYPSGDDQPASGDAATLSWGFLLTDPNYRLIKDAPYLRVGFQDEPRGGAIGGSTGDFDLSVTLSLFQLSTGRPPKSYSPSLVHFTVE